MFESLLFVFLTISEKLGVHFQITLDATLGPHWGPVSCLVLLG